MAVRAIVLKDPLTMRSVRLATSPTTSGRRAWSFTRCRPLIAIFSGSLPLTSTPKTLTLLGSIAFSLRLILRTVGVPFRSKLFTCRRAEPTGSLATSVAALAAPTAISSTAVAVSDKSVAISEPPAVYFLTQYNALRQCISSGRFEPRDEAFRGAAEDVVVGHLAALLRLDPLRPKAVQPPPLLELRAQADHVEEWLLAREAADRRPVIGVEVAMHGDSA